MAHPDPKSFDTLEAAQAEIARLQHLLNRATSLLAGFEAFVQDLKNRAAERAKMFSGSVGK